MPVGGRSGWEPRPWLKEASATHVTATQITSTVIPINQDFTQSDTLSQNIIARAVTNHIVPVVSQRGGVDLYARVRSETQKVFSVGQSFGRPSLTKSVTESDLP